MQSSTKTLLVGFVALAVLVAVAAGISSVVFHSGYYPEIISFSLVVVIAAVSFLVKPSLLIYLTILVIFLPLGIFTAEIQSLLNRSLTVLTFGIWLVDLLLRRRKIIWNTASTFMLGFILWSVVTLFWAGHLDVGLTTIQMYALRFLLFIFLLPNLIREKKDLDGLMKVLALSGWIMMVAGIIQIIQKGYISGSRFQILQMNENEMGLLVLVSLMGIIWPLVQSSPGKKGTVFAKYLIFFIYLLLATVLVIISGSRGNTISLGIIFLCFAIWKRTRRWTIFLLIVGLMILIFTPGLFTTVVDRFLVQRYDTPLGGREVLWEGAWRMILDRPLGGAGIGNSAYDLLRYVANFPVDDPYRTWASIHNPILTVWADTGLFGILLYLGILAGAFLPFARNLLKLTKERQNKEVYQYALIFSVFLGFMASWIKGGGMEVHHSYYLMIALLIITTSIIGDGRDTRSTGLISENLVRGNSEATVRGLQG